MSGVLVRKRSGIFETHRDTGEAQRERLCEDRGRDWNDASTVQSIPRIANNQQALRRVNEGFFPRALVSVL